MFQNVHSIFTVYSETKALG